MSKSASLAPAVRLQPHQARVVERALRSPPRLLLYHGLGTGKTLAAVAAADALGRPYTAVVPAALRPNFADTVRRFTRNGPAADVVSQTAVARGSRDGEAPETLVVDEAHRLRNPGSRVARHVGELAGRARNVFLLSGSPIVNRPGDMAPLINMLTGTRFSPEGFERRYIGDKATPPGFWGRLRGLPARHEPVVKHEEELQRLLKGHVDYEKGQGAPGASVKDEVVDVGLSPAQERFNRAFQDKLPWMLRLKLKYDYPLTDRDIKSLRSFFTGSRLAGLSTAAFGSSPIEAFRGSEKLREAAGRLRAVLANPRKKALIYSNFVQGGLVPYAAHLEREHVPHALFTGALSDRERADVLKRYNAGKLRALLIGPAAAEGVSTRGTQLIQLLDPAFNESRMEQVRGRGLRFDSHKGLPPELRDVTVERYVAHGAEPGWLGKLFGSERVPTADEILARMSERKERLNELFRDQLRRAGAGPPPGRKG